VDFLCSQFTLKSNVKYSYYIDTVRKGRRVLLPR